MLRPLDDLYLAPHFDDAVLSCGGTIHRRARAGRRQLVLTVCAGLPDGVLTPFAAEHHRRWGAPAGAEATAAIAMVARRRAEDDAALAVLGAGAARLALPDAIYRRVAGKRAPYDDLAALFGPLDAGEADRADALAGQLADVVVSHGVHRRTRVWLPLALGGHVDHRLTRAAGEAWIGRIDPRGDRLRVAYYEDMPYAATATRAEVAALARRLRRRCATIDDADLAAKVVAIACYASQISTFWPDAAAMAADVRAWAERACPARPGRELAEAHWSARRERLTDLDDRANGSPS